MDTIEQLERVASQDWRWQESAQGILNEGWDLNDEVEQNAHVLICSYLAHTIKLEELRAGVAWANALDAEAVRHSGSKLQSGGQQLERTARRVMHLSGRLALEAMKSSRRRITLQVKRKI